MTLPTQPAGGEIRFDGGHRLTEGQQKWLCQQSVASQQETLGVVVDCAFDGPSLPAQMILRDKWRFLWSAHYEITNIQIKSLSLVGDGISMEATGGKGRKLSFWRKLSHVLGLSKSV